MAADSVAPLERGLAVLRAVCTSADAAVRPGMITPIWCTGSGRALLWEHTPAQLDELLAGVQFVGVGGPAAARTVAEVASLLERDRAAGLVIAADEYAEGVTEHALPIHGSGGIVAAKNIPMEYAARNATSISPSNAEPSAVLNGSQPVLRAGASLVCRCSRPQWENPIFVWGSSALLTMLVIFRVMWKHAYAKNVRTRTSVW